MSVLSRKGYIYQLCSVENPEKFYIGSTTKKYGRKYQHLYAIRTGAPQFCHKYFKRTGEQPDFIILDVVEKGEDIREWENYYITKLRPTLNLKLAKRPENPTVTCRTCGRKVRKLYLSQHRRSGYHLAHMKKK